MPDYEPDGLGADRDEFYEALMNAHEGLSTEESQKLNARLILYFANQIGDLSTLKRLMAKARQS
jgi:hypothetical protein